MEMLHRILTESGLTPMMYDQFMVFLTLADELPKPLSRAEVMPYFFALQVNYHNDLGETNGRIHSPYMASRCALTCHFNFREYSGFETQQNYSIEYLTIRVKFNCLLNTVVFQIPIMEVQKGLFNTNFRKKTVGYMINPMMEAPGYFVIEDSPNLARYVIPKALYMEFFKDAFYKNGTFLFNDKSDLERFVDKNCIFAVYNMLTEQDFYDVFRIVNIDGDYALDNDYCLTIYSRYEPEIDQVNNYVEWQNIRPNLFRLIYRSKFYIPFIEGNTIRVLAQL
jgi:hypothetical protein